MSRIEKTFQRCAQTGGRALVGFITAGDPTEEVSLKIAKRLCRDGVDVLELGVPFSDPTADGPVIQRASMRALRAGMTLERAMNLAERLRHETETPIILFSYYNPLFRYGAERFYRHARDVGIDGVLVVDLPPEESAEFTGRWNGWSPSSGDFSIIRLIAPTTPQPRMRQILHDASGFVYLISKTGVTGSEEIIPQQTRGGQESDPLNYEEIERMVTAVRALTTLPVCVGFGISTPRQAERIARFADGVVIGSAFERCIEEHLNRPDLYERIGEMASQLKRSLTQR